MPVRVHHRHHRPVLPPVRPDDRRLDGDLGVQLADAEPGPVGAPARSRSAEGELPRPCRGSSFALAGGWRWRTASCARALASAGSRPRSARHSADWHRRRSARLCRAVVGWAGSLAAALNRAPRLASSACSTAASTRRPAVYTRIVGGLLAGQRRWCSLVYGGLLGLTYFALTTDADRLHPAAGQGLSAGQRAAARLPRRSSARRVVMRTARGDRSTDPRRQAHGRRSPASRSC